MHHQAYMDQLLSSNFYPFHSFDSEGELCSQSFDPEPFSLNASQSCASDSGAPPVMSLESSDSDAVTDSEYPEPVTQTCPNESSIHLTDLSNCRETLAAITHYNQGQIGQYLKNFKGLLILPLHAVSIFRIPHGHHTGNYPLLIYLPEQEISQYPHLDNFNDAIQTLYQ